MKTFDDIKKSWDNDQDTPSHLLNKESVDIIIHSRIRSEKKTLMEYFWGSFMYQNLIYGFGTYFSIKYWNDMQFVLPVLAGMIVYIPFTLLMIIQFKAMMNLKTGKNGNQLNTQVYVAQMHTQLCAFYNLKRKFDWITVPLSCLVFVIIIFKVFVGSAPQEHLQTAIILFLAWLSLFMIAIRFENQKRFKKPLLQIESILKDLKTGN